jgi:signal transduction histidine kinase
MSDYESEPPEHYAIDDDDQSQFELNSSDILIGISDRGKGISTKIMPNLFGKFITDSDMGTGLGLYITKNLVEAHGGRIWAFNNNDGIGSTFVFSLPKA